MEDVGHLDDEAKIRLDRVITRINDSRISDMDKISLTNLNIKAAKNTNGRTPEQKIQALTDTVATLAELDTYGVIDRDESARRDKHIQDSLDKITADIKGIDDRLTKNDDKTEKMTEYLHKADEIVEMYKKNSEKEKEEKANEKTAKAIEKVHEDIKRAIPKSWKNILKDILIKIGWPGASVLITGFIVIAFRPEILELFSKIFSR